MEQNIVIIGSKRYNKLPINISLKERWCSLSRKLNIEIGLIDVYYHKDGGFGNSEYALVFDTPASMTMFMMEHFDDH